MILLLTGTPGAGKTAYGLVRAIKFKEEGRQVYAHGVKDLDYEKIGFHRLEDPKKWEDLPDGSVVVIDESYSTFPNRNAASAVPPHVEAMARHRHRGFDFILIAQQGLQLDPFLRGLYEEHIHLRKQFGRKTLLKRWNGYQNNVKAKSEDSETWIRPKFVFEYYTSTVLDTSKLRVPMWARYLIGLVVILLAVFWYIKSGFDARMEEARAQTDAARSSSQFASGDVRSDSVRAASDAIEPRWETAAEYARDHLPRFATMPWTSPVFDQRGTVTDPQLYCMASGPGLNGSGDWTDGGCHCTTEQGTRYDIGEGECRRVARVGTPYNPYTQRSQQPHAAPAPQPWPVDYGGPARRSGEVLGSVGTVGRPMVDESFGQLTRPTP